MSTVCEVAAMRQAIALSALGLGTTSPNPPVGCVILDAAGQIAGQGYHRRKGEAHAEVNALTAAGERAANGTAIVTLEPCNHHGVTPPCHQALIDAGVGRVVVALVDPTSRGEGGIARLLRAGVDVEVGCLSDEASLVLGPWLAALKTRRPHIVCAHLPELPSDKRDLELVGDLQALRSSVDVVLSPDGTAHEAIPGSHLPEILSLGGLEPQVDAEAAARQLYEAGVRRALLEGDAATISPYLEAGVVDHLVSYRHTVPPSSTAIDTNPETLLPYSFRIHTLTRIGGLLRLDAYRQSL